MIFQNRDEAGRKLAEALTEYTNKENTLILGLGKGGIVIAKAVAQALFLPLDILLTRKIGAPINDEFPIGAITEHGTTYVDTRLIRQLQISQDYLDSMVEQEHIEAQKQIALYRENLEASDFTGKRVIIVDDGLATGATAKVAIQAVRERKATEVVLAVPMAPVDAIPELKEAADRFICLHTPDPFYTVKQFYFDFPDIAEEEIVRLLKEK